MHLLNNPDNSKKPVTNCPYELEFNAEYLNSGTNLSCDVTIPNELQFRGKVNPKHVKVYHKPHLMTSGVPGELENDVNLVFFF